MTLFDKSGDFIDNIKRADKFLIFFGIPIVFGVILGLLILFVPLDYFIFVIGGVIFVYLVMFHIDIAIIITLFIQNQLGRFNYLGGDTPYHPNGIIGLLLIGGAILYFITHKIDYSRLKAVGGFLAFILVSAFSLVNAGIYLMDGITILLRIVAAFSIYVVLIHQIESIAKVKWVFGVIIAAQIYPTISGLFLSSGLTGFFFTDETARLGDSGVGVYMSIISILCVIFFFNAKRLSSRVGWGILTIFFLAGLFFSFGRSGWIGFTFALILMAAIRYKKLILILPFILILIIVLVPAIGQRFQDIQISDLGGEGHDTLSGRIKFWQGGLEVFTRNPMLGVGIGLGRYYVGSYLGEYAMMIHNDYISTLVDTGIIGFIIYLIWHFRWFEVLIEAYQSVSRDFDKTAIFSVFIILSSIMVMRFTDNILLDTYDMYPLCAMIAAVLAIPRIRILEKSINSSLLTQKTSEKGQ